MPGRGLVCRLQAFCGRGRPVYPGSFRPILVLRTCAMPNRTLSEAELEQARELIERVRLRIDELAGGDPELLFALRRKVYKELTYDERDKPAQRKRLKALKRDEQDGLCPLCGEPFPETYCAIDRFDAAQGYTPENTRLIHTECDTDVQSGRGYP